MPFRARALSAKFDCQAGAILNNAERQAERARRWIIGLGIVMPALLFIADPGIFSGSFGINTQDEPAFGSVRIFVYGVHGLGSLCLLALLYRPLSRGQTAAAAGALLAGSLVGFAVAIAMLPFTLIGLIFGIGLLGLLPFVVVWIWFREGAGRIRGLARKGGARDLLRPIALGCALVVAPPAAANSAWQRFQVWQRERVPDGLAGNVMRALKQQGRVDLRHLDEGHWDKIGFLYMVDRAEIQQQLGVTWNHPDADKVGIFSSHFRTLLVLVNGKTVVDHALIEQDRLSSCASKIVLLREHAVFDVANGLVCLPGKR